MGIALVTSSDPALAVGAPPNDCPTEARADYVFACMQVNAQTRDSLMKCSCSIDAIAAVLPYPEYASARTIMMMRQSTNRYRELFRTYGLFKNKVADLKRAQVEGELRCF